MQKPAPAGYDAVLARQHERIAELEAALAAAEATLASLRSAPLATLAALAAADGPVPLAPTPQPEPQQPMPHHQTAYTLATHAQRHPHAAAAAAAPAAGQEPDFQVANNNNSVYALTTAAHFAGRETNHQVHHSHNTNHTSNKSILLVDHHHRHNQQHHHHHHHHHHPTSSQTRYWTELEHAQFLRAVQMFGPKNYVAISNFVGTRTPKQVRSHSQKYQLRLAREARKRSHSPGHSAPLRPEQIPSSPKAHEQGLRPRAGPGSSQSTFSPAHTVEMGQNDSPTRATAAPPPAAQQNMAANMSGAPAPPISFTPRKRRPWRTGVEGIVA